MKFIYEIPGSFWGLFRSVNRGIYMEALLTIDDEYQYNNFFLSREACVQILADMCARRRFQLEKEETETEEEALEAELAAAGKMAAENRRLYHDDHQHSHSRLCGGFYRCL